MSLPYIIRENNHCSYPLHPSANYRGEGYHRWVNKIPPDRHIVLLPSWYDFAPGEWRWCSRCTRRNAARIKTVKRLAEKAFTLRELTRIRTPKGEASLRQALKSWGGPSVETLGGRFVTCVAQTRYAKRHAPPGMEWCQYGRHYSAVAEMAHVRIARKQGKCEACYRRHIRGLEMRSLFRWREQRNCERQEFQTLQHQRTALRREIADLRRLKEAIAQEIVALQRPGYSRLLNENSAINSDTIVGGEETRETSSLQREQAPRRVKNDRRKAYSV